MINKVILIGTVGNLDETSIKEISTGSKYYKFGLALQEPKFSKDMEAPEYKTVWVNIVTWNKLAEVCDNFLKKGLMVYVEGKLNPFSFQGNDGQQVKGVNIAASFVKPIEPKVAKKNQTQAPDDFNSLPF